MYYDKLGNPATWTDTTKIIWSVDMGQRIKAYIAKQYGKGRQGEFAKLIGISQGSLSDIINGKSTPSALTLLKFAHNSTISINYLLKGK